ncbi:unnamed protein product [Notodromas monacha]|uniref:Axin-1 n=1 Tax=Notodromas monacha TaxID=399045 RepID=A0A7R9BS26_9CRUS|nr:unnamed protein product [Notodromas monacha]CAG0920641.1 unnamed protein product [Notodromas monacha]
MDAVPSRNDASSNLEQNKLSPDAFIDESCRIFEQKASMPPVEGRFVSDATVFDKDRGPRPPVPGEETAVKFSDGKTGGSSSPPPPPPPPLDPWKKKQILKGCESVKAASQDVGRREGERPPDFAPEGSAAESTLTSRSVSPSNRSDTSASSSSSSSSVHGRPPCFAWANSLQNLLGDSEGVELFQTYLDQELCPSEPLQFWFACRGFGMQQEQGQSDEEVEKLCRVIYRKFLRNQTVPVSESTRRAIVEKLGLEPESSATKAAFPTSSWSAILDRAQQEVENDLSRSTYANFLESDLYLQAVTDQIERRRLKKIQREERKRNKLLRKSQKKELCSPQQTAFFEEKEPRVIPRVPSDQIIKPAPIQTLPLTRKALLATVSDRMAYRQTAAVLHEVGPHSSVSGLTSAATSVVSGSGGGSLHPYHAMYKSYVPVSRQDSELQSLSSDALTDDTMSTITDDCASSVDGRPPPGCSNTCCVKPGMIRRTAGMSSGGSHHRLRHVGSGSHIHASAQHKMHRRLKQQIRMNAEENKESDRVTGTFFIPRTARPLAYDSTLAEKKPAEFAKRLISKLEAVVKEREQEAIKLAMEPAEDDKKKSCSLSVLLVEAMKEKIKAGNDDNFDSDQAILDNHVDRVWADHSEQQTPRTPPGAAKRGGNSNLPPFAGGVRAARGLIGSGTSVTTPGQHYVYAGAGKPVGFQGLGTDHLSHHHRVHHHRKQREKDASSSMSSDSGNVLDSRSSLDGLAVGHGFPKSKSVPDWLVDANQKQHLRSAGGCTDSGLSAISADSNASYNQPLSSRERVLTWVSQNQKCEQPEKMGGGSERGSSSYRRSRASTSALQDQAPSASRSSHRRHMAAGSSSNSGRSVSMERSGGRLSWKQQYQQVQEHQPGTSIDDSGVHFMHRGPPGSAKFFNNGSSGSRSRGVRQEMVISGIAMDDDPNASTIVSLFFYGDRVPFRTKIPGNNVTLKQFKQVVPRKGHYRYFFKREDPEFGSNAVQEEVGEDSALVPLWEGMVIATLKPV